MFSPAGEYPEVWAAVVPEGERGLRDRTAGHHEDAQEGIRL